MPRLTDGTYDLPGERVTRMGDTHISQIYTLFWGILSLIRRYAASM
jgi:hypothetical protein